MFKEAEAEKIHPREKAAIQLQKAEELIVSSNKAAQKAGSTSCPKCPACPENQMSQLEANANGFSFEADNDGVNPEKLEFTILPKSERDHVAKEV